MGSHNIALTLTLTLISTLEANMRLDFKHSSSTSQCRDRSPESRVLWVMAFTVLFVLGMLAYSVVIFLSHPL